MGYGIREIVPSELRKVDFIFLNLLTAALVKLSELGRRKRKKSFVSNLASRSSLTRAPVVIVNMFPILFLRRREKISPVHC